MKHYNMEKKEETKKQAEIVQVPTQMGLAVKLENEQVVNEMELLVKIYNKLLLIEKAVV